MNSLNHDSNEAPEVTSKVVQRTRLLAGLEGIAYPIEREAGSILLCEGDQITIEDLLVPDDGHGEYGQKDEESNDRFDLTASQRGFHAGIMLLDDRRIWGKILSTDQINS